ncbi:MAG: c-type cytochrome [Gemmatimonas sp.]
MISDRRYVALFVAVALCAWSGAAGAQSREGPASAGQPAQYSATASDLLQVPVSGIYPGGAPEIPDIKNPFANDPGAAERGMKHFRAFNCIGCHADNGGGGMGPALSNARWIYRSTPANIFLSISQGRANGMPAWGGMLPPNVIWELVSYIESIGNAPEAEQFGVTISRDPQSPTKEQVPATQLETAKPWDHTEPFHNGQKP